MTMNRILGFSAVLLVMMFSVSGLMADNNNIFRSLFHVQAADTLSVDPSLSGRGDIENLRTYVSGFSIPEIQYKPKPPVKYWKSGVLTQMNISQLSLTNWADGGTGSIAMSAYVDARANYKRKKIIWENRLQLGYGFVQNFDDIYKKADDRIVVDSKWGYEAISKLYMSAVFNFKTQFSKGYKYPTDGTPPVLESQFMAPGNMSLGLGIDYKPFEPLSLNFSPFTGNLVVVERRDLREKYGNAIDQAVRAEFGLQFKINYSQVFFDGRVGILSTLTLFSNFLDSPENIKVNWDLTLDVKVTKFMSVNLRTNLIYDDKIMIADSDGSYGPRVQFKEALSVGLSYSFGSY